MPRTPPSLLAALDQVTGNLIAPEALAAPRMLAAFSPVAQLHLQRARSLFDDPNVVGAGIAEKVVEGEQTGELGLAFYVRRKVPVSELEAQSLIPPVVAGPRGRAIFTDVVEVGDIVPQVNAGPPPLRSGFSIGHVSSTAGTLGAFVRQDGSLYVLSNSHVLAQSGLASIGDTILYPGPADARGSTIRCGTLASFTPFSIGNTFTNTADAALAAIDDDLVASLVDDILGATKPFRTAAPARGMRVAKRGRSSGDTKSVVRDTDFRLIMDYPGVGQVGFTGQVRCDHYTDPGDSGAIVVERDSGAIVGLHFAGSSMASVFTPIATLMAALNFRF